MAYRYLWSPVALGPVTLDALAAWGYW